MSEPSEPTVTLHTQPTGPSQPTGGSDPGSGSAPGRGGVRSMGASSASSRVATPADAIRLDEIRRLRILAAFAAVVCISAAIAMLPMGGDMLAKKLHLPALLVVGVTGAWVTWRLRDPDQYQNWVMMVFSVSAAIAMATAFYYWGVYSSAVLFVPIALYFLASGSYYAPILILLVLTCVPHAILGALTAFGVIEDHGVVRAAELRTYEQLAVAGIAQLAFLVAFLLARGTRRSMIDAVTQLEHALVGICKREALLAEARQDLEQALHVGGPGLYTDQELGSFRIGNLLGRGAMGEVYEASHTATGEPAAVKVLTPTLAGDPGLVKRFLREVQIASSVESPHVVKVVEVAPASSSVPYLAMERLRGESLADMLREIPRLKLDQVVLMINELARGLIAAHAAGIVHRDIKPRNLFRHGDGKVTTWKILDFGVARLAGERGTLTGGNIIGTPSYMSPEQARGQEVDHRTDIHALGLVAYRALTGRPAFAGPDVPSILYAVTHDMPPPPTEMASLPAGVDLALALALAKDPAKRYGTAVELATALTGAARGVLLADVASRAAAVLRDKPWGSRG